LGKGVIAIACLTPVVSACSSDDDDAVSNDTSNDTDSDLGSDTGSSEGTTAPAPASGEAAVTYTQVSFGFVSAYLLVRGTAAAVVDTGVEGSAGQIETALSEASLTWEAVEHVILTHHHPDHAGSVSAVLDAAPAATGYAGEADIPQINSSRPLTALSDGDDVFGLQIIATPGHTPGHVAVFDPVGKLVVVGDALGNDGELSGPNAEFTADIATAIESAKRLATLSAESILFGHGAPIDAGAGDLLTALVATL